MGSPCGETSGIWFGEAFFLISGGKLSYARIDDLHMDSSRWGPLPVRNRFIPPIKWPCKWVTGVATLLIEVVTPLMSETGPTF